MESRCSVDEMLKRCCLRKVWMLAFIGLILVIAVRLSLISHPLLKAIPAELGSSELHLQKYEALDHSRSQCKNNEEIVKRFVLAKIEKTGSSTLYSIFSRFVRKHKLNILIQKSGYHIDWRTDRDEGWIVGPEHGGKADVLINHARFNQSVFSTHMAPDFRYIVPIREPESWFKSAVNYYSISNRVESESPDETVSDDRLFYKSRADLTNIQAWYHLPQLQWLGFNYEHRNNLTAIEDYIAWIVPKIDIVILNDEFDASLVVLRRRYCWKFTDIFYRSSEVYNSNSLAISARTRHKLISSRANLGDQLLYEKARALWWNQPELRDSTFWPEVEYFMELNSNISAVCVDILHFNTSYAVPETTYHSTLEISYEFCEQILVDKIPNVHSMIKYAKDEK